MNAFNRQCPARHQLQLVIHQRTVIVRQAGNSYTQHIEQREYNTSTAKTHTTIHAGESSVQCFHSGKQCWRMTQDRETVLPVHTVTTPDPPLNCETTNSSDETADTRQTQTPAIDKQTPWQHSIHQVSTTCLAVSSAATATLLAISRAHLSAVGCTAGQLHRLLHAHHDEVQ